MKICRIVALPLLTVLVVTTLTATASASYRKVVGKKPVNSQIIYRETNLRFTKRISKGRVLLKNIPPSPNFSAECHPLSRQPSKACIVAVLAAINNAHKETGVPAININPDNLAKMNGPEMLLILVNLERISRGLQPFSGLTRLFDQVARKAAEQKTDPGLSSGEMSFGHNGYVANWGGNWAENITSPLAASYDFVYQDGPGSFNVLCRPQNESGCYGHMENILGQYPYARAACGGLKPELLMGASVLNHHVSASNQPSMTELFVGACVRRQITPYIKWTVLEKELSDGNSPLVK